MLVALLPTVLGVGIPAAHAAAPLVAQYHVDDLSGADSSGNGLNGAAGPGATLVPGRFGNAVHPASGSGLTVPGNALFRPATVSLVLWFKQSGDPGTLKYLASGGGEGPGGCNGSPYAMYTHYQAGQGLSFYVRGVSGAPHLVSAGTGVWDGNWHLAVGTFDGTYTRLYVDGKEAGGSAPPSPDTINYGVATDQTFRIGEYSAQAGCGPSSSFPGALDEVRIYDRALSATEIARLAAATGSEPPALVPDGGGGGDPQPIPVGPSPIPLGPGQGANPPRLFGLNPSAPVRAGGLSTIGLGVEGASQINVDANGDGKDDGSCPGTSNAIALRAPTAAGRSGINRAAGVPTLTSRINLSAIGLNGVRSPAQQIIVPTLPAPAAPAGGGQLIRPAFMFTCGHVSTPGDISNGIGNVLSAQINCIDQSLTFGILEVSGCMVHATSRSAIPTEDRKLIDEWTKNGGNPNVPIDVWASAKPVKVNGLTVDADGARLTYVFPNLGRVVASKGTVKFGTFTVREGAINLDARAQPGTRHDGIPTVAPATYNPAIREGGATIDGGFDAKKSLNAIGGFPLDARAQLQLWSEGGRHYSEAMLHLGLPDIFTAFGGKPPSAAARITADNRGGPSIDGLDIKVPNLELGSVQLTDVAFHYNVNGHAQEPTCGAKYWSATANIFIGDKSSENGRAGFRLAPDPPQNGVHFCGGGFLAAGGTVDFGGPIPPPVIFPGVTLQSVSLQVQLDPPLLHGGVTMDVAEVARVKGDLLVVLASPGSPYTITTADAASFQAVSGTRLVAPTVAVGGEVSVKLPGGGELGMGSGHFLYEYPDYVDLGGSVSLAVPGIRLTGSLRGQFKGSTKQFNIEGRVDACLGVDLFCGTVAGWISDRGVAVCVGDIVKDDWVPGVGYGWGNLLPDIWFPTGCKPSRYWDHNISAPRSARAAQGAAPVTFEVSADEERKSVMLIGADGKAPDVTLKAPDGETVTLGADKAPPRIVHGKRIGLAQDASQGITVAGVLKGKPGTYTVTPLPGSPSIVKVKETREDDGEGVTAKVTRGKGESYVLEYDAGPVGGKEVTFAEAANGVAHDIKTVKGGSGKIAFTPQDGRGGTRELVARTTLDGKPIPDEEVAKYAVADGVTPGTVRDLKVKRVGKDLEISWAEAKNAERYGVALRQANGALKLLSARAEHITIKNVSREFAGTVTVSAEGGLPGVYGTQDKASFSAPERPDSAFLDYKKLGTGQAKLGKATSK
ncbi:LamG domain-containing protein [Baekduia sp. Peel2402]|uniref:LamG domain-containing protein n=1 Tax=Baekduia sp. Peel2402 TaxID=3458296 RepID=UPI00403E98C0